MRQAIVFEDDRLFDLLKNTIETAGHPPLAERDLRCDGRRRRRLRKSQLDHRTRSDRQLLGRRRPRRASPVDIDWEVRARLETNEDLISNRNQNLPS